MKNNSGFTALIAVILLATGTIAFSLVTLSAAVSYADAVNQRETRIQAGLNAQSCLDVAVLMLSKDFFLNGEVTIPEFGCVAMVDNPNAVTPQTSWTVRMDVVAELNWVKGRGNRTVSMSEFLVMFESDE